MSEKTKKRFIKSSHDQVVVGKLSRYKIKMSKPRNNAVDWDEDEHFDRNYTHEKTQSGKSAEYCSGSHKYVKYSAMERWAAKHVGQHVDTFYKEYHDIYNESGCPFNWGPINFSTTILEDGTVVDKAFGELRDGDFYIDPKTQCLAIYKKAKREVYNHAIWYKIVDGKVIFKKKNLIFFANVEDLVHEAGIPYFTDRVNYNGYFYKYGVLTIDIRGTKYTTKKVKSMNSSDIARYHTQIEEIKSWV